MPSTKTLRSPYGKEIFPSEIVNKLTIPEYLLEKAEEAVKAGKDDWIIDGVTGQRKKFKDVEFQSRQVACELNKRGLKSGDVVLYLTYEMFNIYPIFIGVWRANGVMRASYPEDIQETLLERVKESNVKWILCEPDAAEMCLKVAKSVEWDVEVFVNGEVKGCTPMGELFNNDGKGLPTLMVKPDDPAFILCTSGTTGKSKGAVHTHRSLLHIYLCMQYNPWSDKPNLISSKGTHALGTIVPLTLLTSGKTCVTVSIKTKENFSGAIHSFKPGLIFGFPPLLISLLDNSEESKYDFSSVEIVSIGGSPVTPSMIETFKKLPNVKNVLNSYGMTELLPIATDIFIGSKFPSRYPGTPECSIGKAYPGTQIQIRDPDTKEILEPYKEGEIWVKSPTRFKCYCNNINATEALFYEGWLMTGDVGYYDENEFIFIVDRMKEIFKYLSNHISPTELEGIISNHEAVDEVCVVGVNDGVSRIPRAFVKLKLEYLGKDEQVLAEDIKQFTNAKVANYKHLRGGIHFIANIPRGKTGKILRRQLEEM